MSSGLFEQGDDGCITSHLIARRVRRADYSVDEATGGVSHKVSHKVETLQVADGQAKSASYQEHINLERERERERERELEYNNEIDKEKELDVDVDNTRARIIDFGPDAADVDFLTLCIDKIFSQQIWLQSLASEKCY